MRGLPEGEYNIYLMFYDIKLDIEKNIFIDKNKGQYIELFTPEFKGCVSFKVLDSAGNPVQNAFVERFNRLYREDVLDAYLFSDIEQVKDLSEKWKEDYNEKHPHGSLGGKAPRQFSRYYSD